MATHGAARFNLASRSILRTLLALSLVLLVVACSSAPLAGNGRDYLPGGSEYYSFGTAQSKENFSNIERAQSYYGLYTKERWWGEVRPVVAPASVNMLSAYYPLDVRWKLKDGREFSLEKIDVQSIMREYFRNNKIDLPFQREGRKWAQGDYDPTLAYEVRDDAVILKWLIRNNKTPLERRGKELPKIEYEEYVVTTLKGQPTSGIPFDKRVEVVK